MKEMTEEEHNIIATKLLLEFAALADKAWEEISREYSGNKKVAVLLSVASSFFGHVIEASCDGNTRIRKLDELYKKIKEHLISRM